MLVQTGDSDALADALHRVLPVRAGRRPGAGRGRSTARVTSEGAGSNGATGTMPPMATHTIRVFGDPVLKRPAAPMGDIDGVDGEARRRHVRDDVRRARRRPGRAQVGVQKRFFVYDIGDGPNVLFNPEIVEATGEWSYEEGCLSLPGLAFEIVRPKVVTVQGIDLGGDAVVVQGDELLGRVFLHEIDHLDGVLMLDRLERADRKRALRELREQGMGVKTPGGRRHAL